MIVQNNGAPPFEQSRAVWKIKRTEVFVRVGVPNANGGVKIKRNVNDDIGDDEDAEASF